MERLVTEAFSGIPAGGEERMDAHKKVMFVDDDAGVRNSWSRYLSAEGFEVTTAEDGDRAIRQLEREPVDVVVSDLRMPKADGVEVLEWIHDHKPDTRFILVTGFGNEELERKVRELGAFEYLDKPVSPEVLSAVVTAATIMAKAEERKRDQTRAVAVEEEAPQAGAVEVRQRGRVMEALEVAGWLVAAPLLGLAFVVFLPVIGFVALIKTLGEIVWERTDPAHS